MSSDLGASLAAEVAGYHTSQPLCGVLRISGPDGVILEQAYGEASRQLGVPNRPGTKFHIASATKMFIAATVLRLVDEGRLELAAHPGAYRPEFAPIDSRTTLHHLLSHTSGLADIYDVSGLKAAMERLLADGGSFPAYLAGMPQLFSPGERWGYSSTGFLILAYVAETVTGEPFGALLRRLFLDPIGMHDTGEDDPRLVNSGRAYGHFTLDGRDGNAEDDRLAIVPAPRELYSTAADLDLWGRALFGGRVLSPEAAAKSFTSYGTSTFDPVLGYGYGWFLAKPFRMIGGQAPGFRSAMWQFRERELNVIMLWNDQAVDSHLLFRRLRPLLGI
jgi:CubicO group peptidase (beta-lactamase class C family)